MRTDSVKKYVIPNIPYLFIVAFSLPRRSYLITAMFGILKTGAAYLPIDPEYPRERIRFMLEDSGAAFFLTEAELPTLLSDDGTGNPELRISSDSLCYCIYTSGTTGKPKGVLIKHKNLQNYIAGISKTILSSEIKLFLAISTVCFDIFTTECILPLIKGLSTIFADENQANDPQQLQALLFRYQPDVIQATPTKIHALQLKLSPYLKHFKLIILGGELIEPSFLMKLQVSPQAQIINVYGPSETSVGVTLYNIQKNLDVTIGRPIANTQIYILDQYMRPAPIGVTGELCVAGDSVGAGYLNRPELTEERFIDNPFGPGKLYKTGDLAYWREDGNLVYVGRNDFQVKIRGLRVELGEIENALQNVEGVSQAVVVVRKREDGRQFLCAFYTGQKQEGKTLRAVLGRRLPQYMLPHTFTHLEDMPLTASGKVNRKALPQVELTPASTASEYAAPATVREKVLVQCIAEVLGIEAPGVRDGFLDLGGDSLKAIELTAALERAGYHTEVRRIFEAASLRELAEWLEAAGVEREAELPDNPIPATEAQLRIYTAQAMAGGTAYNVPCAFRVKSLDPGRLQDAVSALVTRHEGFRTWFESRGDG